MDARLDRRRVSLRAIGRRQFIAAADRRMHNVHRTAGAGAKLEHFDIRQRLGDRRSRQAVRAIVGDVARFNSRGEGAHHFVVLVVNAGNQAARADLH